MKDIFKISFVGAGAMTSAIVAGLIKNGFDKSLVRAFDISEAASAKFTKSTGIASSDKIEDAVRDSDVIVIAVKPQSISSALNSIKDFAKGKLLISIVAGVNILKITRTAEAKRVIRAMPNTPALVGEGITAISSSDEILAGDQETALRIFNSVGKTVIVNEKLMDAVTGLSGSGPAYVFDFIQALSDAGVNNGLSRDIAFKLASQTVYGAAKLLIESGEHPSILKENVTSPGGTTARGLAVLERGAFKGIISESVTAATERSRELGKD